MGYWIRDIVTSDAGILVLSFLVSVVVMCWHLDDLAGMAWVLVPWSCFSFTLGHWMGIVGGGNGGDSGDRGTSRYGTIRDIASFRGRGSDIENISRRLLEQRNMISVVKSLNSLRHDGKTNTPKHHFWSNLTSHMKKTRKRIMGRERPQTSGEVFTREIVKITSRPSQKRRRH
jgi:hypothetical protein